MLLPICLRSSIFSRLFFLKTFMKHKPYQNTRYPESSLKGSSRRRNSVSWRVSLRRENGADQVKSNQVPAGKRGWDSCLFCRQKTPYEKLQ